MVAERHKLRHNLKSSNIVTGQTKPLRAQINKLGRDIGKRLKQIQIEHAERLAEEIPSTDDTRVMFEAVRSLCKTKETKPLIVHNNQGNPACTDKEKQR